MVPVDISCYIHWRLEWHPGGSSRQCQCQTHHLTKQHIIHCLRIHLKLHVSLIIQDSIFHILNKLPKSPLRCDNLKHYQSFIWLILSRLLSDVDPIQHYEPLPFLSTHNYTNSPFIIWINNNL